MTEKKEKMQYFLVLLMEEASEVILAASKAYRFGLEHDQPGYGEGTNKNQITIELGDLLGIAELLQIDSSGILKAKKAKLDRLKLVEEKYAKIMKRANQ